MLRLAIRVCAIFLVGVAMTTGHKAAWAQDLPGELPVPLWSEELGAELDDAPTSIGSPPAVVVSDETGEGSLAPSYVIDAVVVHGNRRTATETILRVIHLARGTVLTPDDPRIPAARHRLLALGHFLAVTLTLERGVNRGRVVLRVDVEERGAVTVRELYLAQSRMTPLWAGADVAAANLLGRGAFLAGALVGSAAPRAMQSEAGWAGQLECAWPVASVDGTVLLASVLGSRGSEFFQATGPPGTADPRDYVASTTRRMSGRLGLAVPLSRDARVYGLLRADSFDAHLPAVRAQRTPSGDLSPIDFGILAGRSALMSFTFGVDVDARVHRVLSLGGRWSQLALESALPALGSHYSFGKGTAAHIEYFRLGFGHTLGLHFWGGAIFGDAPLVDVFFIGDLHPLMPHRALGLNFSTVAAPDLLAAGIRRTRFGTYAGRIALEYAIPVLGRRGRIYGGEAFLSLGGLALATDRGLKVRDSSLYRALPIDGLVDIGLRLDTALGTLNLTLGNVLGRLPL